eukprot:12357131-Alexandrium_andersonii.AAC.1
MLTCISRGSRAVGGVCKVVWQCGCGCAWLHGEVVWSRVVVCGCVRLRVAVVLLGGVPHKRRRRLFDRPPNSKGDGHFQEDRKQEWAARISRGSKLLKLLEAA